jgi:hypothetical protein
MSIICRLLAIAFISLVPVGTAAAETLVSLQVTYKSRCENQIIGVAIDDNQQARTVHTGDGASPVRITSPAKGMQRRVLRVDYPAPVPGVQTVSLYRPPEPQNLQCINIEGYALDIVSVIANPLSSPTRWLIRCGQPGGSMSVWGFNPQSCPPGTEPDLQTADATPQAGNNAPSIGMESPAAPIPRDITKQPTLLVPESPTKSGSITPRMEKAPIPSPMERTDSNTAPFPKPSPTAGKTPKEEPPAPPSPITLLPTPEPPARTPDQVQPPPEPEIPATVADDGPAAPSSSSNSARLAEPQTRHPNIPSARETLHPAATASMAADARRLDLDDLSLPVLLLFAGPSLLALLLLAMLLQRTVHVSAPLPPGLRDSLSRLQGDMTRAQQETRTATEALQAAMKDVMHSVEEMRQKLPEEAIPQALKTFLASAQDDLSATRQTNAALADRLQQAARAMEVEAARLARQPPD